jgi:hypothetical protein
VALFIHVFAREPFWRRILAQVEARIVDSGLKERAQLIALGVVGTTTFENPMTYATVLFTEAQSTRYEFPTLRALWQFAHSLAEARLLYVHLKGVSRGQVKSTWRDKMLDACVMRHREALDALDTHDVAGMKWKTNHGAPHFSGNFWWATAAYIRTLEDPTHYRHSGHPLSNQEGGRYNAEFWVGSGSPRPYIL